jgi:hypothetical protein
MLCVHAMLERPLVSSQQTLSGLTVITITANASPFQASPLSHHLRAPQNPPPNPHFPNPQPHPEPPLPTRAYTQAKFDDGALLEGLVQMIELEEAAPVEETDRAGGGGGGGGRMVHDSSGDKSAKGHLSIRDFNAMDLSNCLSGIAAFRANNPEVYCRLGNCRRVGTGGGGMGQRLCV